MAGTLPPTLLLQVAWGISPVARRFAAGVAFLSLSLPLPPLALAAAGWPCLFSLCLSVLSR